MSRWAWTTTGLRLRSNLLIALALVMVLAALAAGLARLALPGFAAVTLAFGFARLMERPWLISRLAAPGGVLALSQTMAVQVALVLALYWLGTGLSVLTDWQPLLPLWLPAAVVVGAALLSRLIWRPLPPEWDGFLDEATETLNRMAAETEAMNRPEDRPVDRPENGDDTAKTPPRTPGGRQG
ncbi:hypothetical protein [Szabonella alba]|uniref:Uncharacterized protein n=1 Tax=Szabonella alba TaxID=2804194 RepID=A0A8K0VBL1_9RHOB|nr:hypothetical protein [Szabonella alba]MBL4916880.1 hypothetical protein [Szabonella alba]